MQPEPDERRPARRSSAQGPVYAGGIETQRILSFFGQNTRAGYWEPPERLEVMAVFGGAKLDFSDANLYSGPTEVFCFALFGGIDIIVPSDVEVDANGTGLFGGFEHKSAKKVRRSLLRRRDREPVELDPEFEDDPPILRVRGFALFGGVTIKSR